MSSQFQIGRCAFEFVPKSAVLFEDGMSFDLKARPVICSKALYAPPFDPRSRR